MIDIVVCDKDESSYLLYKSDVIPRKGELINFPHHGSFRILEVAYRVSDDSPFRDNELLMFVEIIVDLSNPIKSLNYLEGEK